MKIVYKKIGSAVKCSLSFIGQATNAVAKNNGGSEYYTILLIIIVKTMIPIIPVTNKIVAKGIRFSLLKRKLKILAYIDIEANKKKATLLYLFRAP